MTWTRRWSSRSSPPPPGRSSERSAHHCPTANAPASATSKTSVRSGSVAASVRCCVSPVTRPWKNRTAPNGLSWALRSMPSVVTVRPPKSSSRFERV
ncbi:Uncharacterised protein [Mycobacteroides abscessus]|nr:Uncharacterised protein [Mycobacteroides abscessus]